MTQIPQVDYAIIGGSGTWAITFPEDVGDASVTVEQRDLVFETPYGSTAPMKMLHLAPTAPEHVEKRVLHVPMHGWRKDSPYSRMESSEQLFWLYQQAGVKQILVEASVGGLNHLLEPGDILVPHDFIDERTSRTLRFTSNVGVLRMRSPACKHLSNILIDEAEKRYRRVMRRGVSVVFEGGRLETPAEIQLMRQMGGDIVGQSATPEVYLARAIGAHISFLNIISNYAEGVNDDWRTEDWNDFYLKCGPTVGQTIIDAMKRLSADPPCECARFFPRPLEGVRDASKPSA